MAEYLTVNVQHLSYHATLGGCWKSGKILQTLQVLITHSQPMDDRSCQIERERIET